MRAVQLAEGRTGMLSVLLSCRASPFFTAYICPPSFTVVTGGGATQAGVSGGEPPPPPSWRRMTKCVFLHTTPVELRELSVGLRSWISSSSSGGPAAEDEDAAAGPAAVAAWAWLNSTVPGLACLDAPLERPLVPARSRSKWMLTASCWRRTDTGIRQRRVSSACRTAPE
ncbi:hypothetical protein EYF80_044526 [Liparis tanakae]|uniref:Uncharacterized protein n=1 Tax=Liparis tanakae TaxID=230148 RepID=A0A4Z2FVP7_9TELE|nr:hypothetical protein EYF80_044526 [Liparis tanakae]